MSKLELKVKKVLDNAVLPEYGSDGAACFDLVAASEKVINTSKTGRKVEYDTGLAFEIPEGYVGLVFPRSSVTSKTSLMLGNGVGVIDSDYRGTVKFQYREMAPVIGFKYNVGDRIGQMMILPVPTLELVETQELSSTERGEGGFGSTGQ